MFQIFVESSRFSTIVISINNNNMLVRDLKEIISEKLNKLDIHIDIHKYKLIMEGKLLEDNRPVRDYNLIKESKIRLEIRISGSETSETETFKQIIEVILSKKMSFISIMNGFNNSHYGNPIKIYSESQKINQIITFEKLQADHRHLLQSHLLPFVFNIFLFSNSFLHSK